MNKNKNNIIVILVIALVALLLYGILTMPDQRTTGERVGDAIDQVSEGGSLEDAAEELDRRTPGERLGDAVEEAGEEIEENTGN